MKNLIPQRRNVTFELPAAVYTDLHNDASARGSSSIHQRAKEIVVDYFAATETRELLELIQQLQDDQAQIRTMLRRVVYSVIVHAAGKPSDIANTWIKDHMSDEQLGDARGEQ